ncbi:hypothetical protein BGP_2552 [Beggiatoa sp. PS]|nr:hypothetical protein BGP_2552 [Beggiatoa sp. PS]
MQQHPEIIEIVSQFGHDIIDHAIAKAKKIAVEPASINIEKHAIDDHDVKHLEQFLQEKNWQGPLIVSKPRTGSTIMGISLLFAKSFQGDYQFPRYIHEPVAPIFWQGATIDTTFDILSQLHVHDIIQESAYQFTHEKLAHLFLKHARKPIVFLTRHPRIAWVSRWRIILNRLLEKMAVSSLHNQITHALKYHDFSTIGHVLARDVKPNNNGWYAFLYLQQLCEQHNFEYVIIDNTIFRQKPTAIFKQLFQAWQLPFDLSVATWQNLKEVRSRIVMGNMASHEEYHDYYAKTIDSQRGIHQMDEELLAWEKLPKNLRGFSQDINI